MTEYALLVKGLGSFLGSSVATLFKPGKDTKWLLGKRIFLGGVIGWIFSPVVLFFAGLIASFFVSDFVMPQTLESYLIASFFGGLVGILFLKILYSDEFFNNLKKRVSK